jgi:hypothetical protein
MGRRLPPSQGKLRRGTVFLRANKEIPRNSTPPPPISGSIGRKLHHQALEESIRLELSAFTGTTYIRYLRNGLLFGHYKFTTWHSQNAALWEYRLHAYTDRPETGGMVRPPRIAIYAGDSLNECNPRPCN